MHYFLKNCFYNARAGEHAVQDWFGAAAVLKARGELSTLFPREVL